MKLLGTSRGTLQVSWSHEKVNAAATLKLKWRHNNKKLNVVFSGYGHS
jgi:hypothetical protein